ncbi:hypothetical protein QRD89_01965 [Halobacillus sp. ACCC02827]|uniref:hypothetical protein n=1 Tax=Bacillaceae TaxID=186817 RepID=UPI000415AAF5|nr:MULTISPECIES: hypothetical protein [Bacillaceae]QHT45369.1 hypothetical protein M662_02080 [Bacillus sp. SB49]WJE16154.1 hypothetical protein QRD89_01965 [Halobacillus sp. ACCC02827]
MTYSVNLIKLFTRRDDHLFRLNEAERLRNVWNLLFFTLVLTVLTYTWTAWLGLGTDAISANMDGLTRTEYEQRKAWFLIGRTAFALGIFLFVLFISSFFFWLFNNVSYKKLFIIQMNVLLIMLLERITWIPLMVYAGIDWYVSPLSFGVIASYITSIEWIIYFFGAISIFQLFIIWYQVKCLTWLSTTRKGWIWTGVIVWHILLWAGTSALAHYDLFLLYLIR